MIKLRERNVGGISRKAPSRHFLVWLMSDNGKNITVWGTYIQTRKCWRREPIVVNYSAQPGLDCLRPQSTFSTSFFDTKKQTAPVLLVIFSREVLQMLHFPVTLYPTLSLLNMSAAKL